LNEAISQKDDLISQLQAALSLKEDKDKEINKLLEERTYEGKIKEDLSIQIKSQKEEIKNLKD
jgi:hypothetical protein